MRKLIKYCSKCGADAPKRLIDNGGYLIECYDNRISECECGGGYIAILLNIEEKDND